MIKGLYNSIGPFWSITRVIFALLFVWHTGFTPDLYSGWNRNMVSECVLSCPCEVVHTSAVVQNVQNYENNLPQEHSGEHCTPGCFNCLCCSGTVSAVILCYRSDQNNPPDELISLAPAEEPDNGPNASIFHPPRLTLS